MSITCLSGCAIFAPIAAGYPKPIAPSPADVMKVRGEREIVILARPHLVLADSRRDDRISLGQLVKAFDDILRLNHILGVLEMSGCSAFQRLIC